MRQGASCVCQTSFHRRHNSHKSRVGIYCLDPRFTCALGQVNGAINRMICCQLGW